MFVKDRSGQTRAVADSYILQDGESVALGMMAFDAAPSSRRETSDDLYRRLVIDRTEDAAPVTATGRNGPPVTIKDDGERSDEFAKGAAFASRELYERRVSDAWKAPEPEPVDRISDIAFIDPTTGHGGLG